MAYDVRPDDELLAVVGCELELRPAGAPGPAELAPYLLDASRDGGALTFRFGPGAEATLDAFAAAERLCCSGIGWEVSREPTPTLRIVGSAEQLDVIAGAFLA